MSIVQTGNGQRKIPMESVIALVIGASNRLQRLDDIHGCTCEWQGQVWRQSRVSEHVHLVKQFVHGLEGGGGDGAIEGDGVVAIGHINGSDLGSVQPTEVPQGSSARRPRGRD